MFPGKDAANAAYPTQWALNPTAYQNIDSSQVDWAALAQQWIAMKEAAVIVAGPPAKPEIEEGEAPMEVENPDPNSEVPDGPDGEWSSSPNTWGNSWNQWGWGWPGAGPVDPKIAGDPAMAIAPLIDGYPVPDATAPMPGYTTGTVPGPTFQHGYWTAPQAEQNDRSASRSRDRRSKSKNRDSKVTRSRSQRDKPPLIPPVIEPIVMPTPMVTSTIDAAKRRQLPAWIREGLEKMEREKQKAIEREEEKKARELAEIEKKRLEEEEMERLKAEAGGQPMLPAKSKFDSDSEESEAEASDAAERAPASPPRSDLLQEVMMAVRRSLTEILLEVTDQEILTVSQEELARYNAAQGLGAYESSDDSEEETNDLTDQQLQEIIKRKRLEFERTSREIDAEVRRAELKESAEGIASPANATPERPRRSRSSATPPPVDSETPEKILERRPSKEKRPNHKSTDKVDGRKLDTIPEEKQKKSSKHDDNTPSPQKSNKASKDSTNSSSSDSEDDSSSDGKSSSESEPEVVKAESRSKKRKRKSSSSSESRRKTKKPKKEKYKSSDKHHSRSKHREEYEKQEKSKRRRDEYYDKHKSSRDSHKDKYRDDSEEDRPRKRSKRSRSVSYESRSGRRKSRDRSDDRSRHKRSYDRDRSYDRYDRYDRYERSRDDRRESRSRSDRHRR